MIRIFFETGIRSNELLLITKANVINNSIKINGKGNKERKVYMSEWLTTEVNEYINSISTLRLFPFGYKNLYKKVSNISNRKITPHMFRRGYAKYCHEKGISIYDISLSMGHSNISTTAKYIEKNSEDVNIYTIF